MTLIHEPTAGLTIEKLRQAAALLDANRIYFDDAHINGAYYDFTEYETVEFCGFKFKHKRAKEEPFDVKRFAARIGIPYLPDKVDYQWSSK